MWKTKSTCAREERADRKKCVVIIIIVTIDGVGKAGILLISISM